MIVAELRSLTTAPFPGSLDEYAEWLATRLVSVVNMMAPELVVLGDLFAAAGGPRRNLVQERSRVSRAVGAVRIETSPLSREATPVRRPRWRSSRCLGRSETARPAAPLVPTRSSPPSRTWVSRRPPAVCRGSAFVTWKFWVR